MTNDLNELDSILFNTLRGVQNGEIDEKKAQTIANVSSTILNSAKIQLNAYKITKGRSQMHSLGQLDKPSPKALKNGDTYELKHEFAIQKGYSSVSDAMDKMDKSEFENQFNDWYNTATE